MARHIPQKKKGDVHVKDDALIKVLEQTIAWMEESEDNCFYTEFLMKNLPITLRHFQNRVKDSAEDSDLKKMYNQLRDMQELKYMKKGMNAKNPVFMIFLLCNHYRDKYKRNDTPAVVEIKEEKTDKIIFKFAEPKPKDE